MKFNFVSNLDEVKGPVLYDTTLFLDMDKSEIEAFFSEEIADICYIYSRETTSFVKSLIQNSHGLSFFYPSSINLVRKAISLLLQNTYSYKKMDIPERFINLNHNEIFTNTFVGNSNHVNFIKNELERIAKNNRPVLLIGETGVGKSTAAKHIHELSDRNKEVILEVDAATINENLGDSKLFGTKVGAYTDATALQGLLEITNGGTLFLDGITKMPKSIQNKLETFLDTGMFQPVGNTFPVKVDVRIIVATNDNIEKMVEEGTFSEALYYRLRSNKLYIPPLRERKEDIRDLVKVIINNENICVEDDVYEMLEAYSWPGNVRELINTICSVVEKMEKGIIRKENINL